MNWLGFSRAYVLLVVAIIFGRQAVDADGLIEVFQWRQMDFYNRGDGSVNQESVGSGGGGTSSASNKTPSSIIFPDQLPQRYQGGSSKRPHRFRRADPKAITSRDQPSNIKTEGRFNAASMPTGAAAAYIPYNNVPMGATHYNGRLFVTMPRRRVGIPSTLNYVDMRRDGNQPSPKLYAYPDFETNQLSADFRGNPEHIVSVYRTTTDACKRLWFIDTGMLEYPDNRMQIQRPSIWIMDLTNDRLVRRFEIPASIVETGRGLASITIDVTPTKGGGGCDRAFAYIPDLVYNQLYVYSFEQNRIWTFTHNYFNFDPLAGDLNIGGQMFRWDDGIFSLTLGPPVDNDPKYRLALFHPMASNNEFMVSTRVLQNETAATAGSNGGNDFRLLGNRGEHHQSTMHEYDPRTGVVFYDEIQQNGVGCWNSRRPFNPTNHGTVASDAQRMIYPSDLTIDSDGTIWVMSNSMPIFIYSTLDPTVVNFRVWKQNVFEAVKNTICN